MLSETIKNKAPINTSLKLWTFTIHFLPNAVNAISKRIGKAHEKLATAEQEGSENIAILSESVGKLEMKLVDAQQAYDDYKQQP